MKISMIGFSDPTWKDGEAIIEHSRQLIDQFGAERCMFGTNYFVDSMEQVGGWQMKKFVEVWAAICKGMTPAQQARLYRETAIEAYNMEGQVKL